MLHGNPTIVDARLDAVACMFFVLSYHCWQPLGPARACLSLWLLIALGTAGVWAHVSTYVLICLDASLDYLQLVGIICKVGKFYRHRHQDQHQALLYDFLRTSENLILPHLISPHPYFIGLGHERDSLPCWLSSASSHEPSC